LQKDFTAWNSTMTIQLGNHFVAFIDILGFSEMVRSDCESSEPPRFLQLLYNSHLQAIGLFGKDLQADLIQFSDSIVFSKPFDLSKIEGFVDAIATWQKSLLLNGLLCRGGISFGKHFMKDKFLFSKAMIDAYFIENSLARFPRVVVSNDLLQLTNTTIKINPNKLLKEDDGATFVNYLQWTDETEKNQLKEAVARLTNEVDKLSSSVQEKLRWLTRYADHILGTTLSPSQFTAF